MELDQLELERRIEAKKMLLREMVHEFGLQHPTVILISQDLDLDILAVQKNQLRIRKEIIR